MSAEGTTARPAKQVWKVAAASVTGFVHEDAAQPCQDAHCVEVLPGGWLVAAVCDGAGSAPRAQEGASIVSRGVVECLKLSLASHIAGGGAGLDEAAARAWGEQAIQHVREYLAELAEHDSHPVSDFHATLVCAIAGPDGGMFLHIGDGAGFATALGDVSKGIISRPENGEYAEETFFVTQVEWRQHLRVTPFGAGFDVVALMSDGAMPLMLSRGASGAHLPIFSPMSRYLATHGRQDGERELAALFRRDTIRAITGDDKTLVWAMRTAADD